MGNEGSHQVKYGEKLENDVQINWEKLPKEATIGLHGRDGHCACTVKDKLYIFGGIVPQKAIETGSLESDEILVVDLVNKTCLPLKTSGSNPPARSSATMAAVGKKIYLFGGLSRETGWFDTVHQFDTETLTWSQLETPGTIPSPRDKLASAVINNNIYIFGGFGPQGMEDELDDTDEDSDEDVGGAQFGWFNDLFIFDTETRTFSSPMQMNLGCPTPRAAHGMCSIDKYLVIFGGRDADARKNDLHIFDTESRKWQTDVVIQGRQPEPRSFHTVTAVGDRVVIMGGRGTSDQHFQDFHIFDTAKRLWIQPEIDGELPCARGLHAAGVVGDQFVVYGGSGNYSKETLQCSDYYNDLHAVKTDCIMTGSGYLPPDITSVADQSASSETLSTKRPLDTETVSSSESTENPTKNVDSSPKRLRTDE